MKDRAAPLFLEQRSYRRRRLIDAARVLPVAALVLFIMPALLGAGREGGMARLVIYFFGVWFLLVLGTAILSRALSRRDGDRESAR